MKKFLGILLTIILSAFVSYAVATHTAFHTANPKSVYDSVLDSGTLRCGYFEEAPFTIVDPNTKQMSGIAVDLAAKITSKLGLKIEWTGVANPGTFVEDLSAGRYDLICGSVFNLPRGGRLDYTIPYAYAPVYGYTQTGRTEFDGELNQFDWSKISIAGLDGEAITVTAHDTFPQAHLIILPQSAQIADMLTSVASNKADIGFAVPTVFKDFDKNNPNKLKRVSGNTPFHTFSLSFAMKSNEPALKNTIDFIIRDMVVSGELQALFKKYDPDGLLFQPAAPYKPAL